MAEACGGGMGMRAGEDMCVCAYVCVLSFVFCVANLKLPFLVGNFG